MWRREYTFDRGLWPSICVEGRGRKRKRQTYLVIRAECRVSATPHGVHRRHKDSVIERSMQYVHEMMRDNRGLHQVTLDYESTNVAGARLQTRISVRA